VERPGDDVYKPTLWYFNLLLFTAAATCFDELILDTEMYEQS
jgi:hypothetical protein